MTDVVHEGCGYELDGFDVEVPSPFLELRHAHYQVAYETIDCVAKVCELFRLNGDDLVVCLIVDCEKGEEELFEMRVYALGEHEVLVEDPVTDDVDDSGVCGIFFNDGVPSAIAAAHSVLLSCAMGTLMGFLLALVANCMFVLC